MCRLLILMLPPLVVASSMYPPLRCLQKSCRYLGDEIGDQSILGYEVDGKDIMIRIWKSSFVVDCYKSSVLDSHALPRAEPALFVSTVGFENCPLPSNNSLANILTSLNVKLNFEDKSGLTLKPTSLLLKYLRPGPALGAKHFYGLQNLTSLTLLTKDDDGYASIQRGFLAPLQSLEELNMKNVIISAFKFDPLPLSIKKVTLQYVGLEQIPDSMVSSASLRSLKFNSMKINVYSVGPALTELVLHSPATFMKLDSAPALEKLMVHAWMEEQPQPMKNCDNLRTIELTMPALRNLPSGWLAQCSRLTSLIILNAYNLIALPEKIFEKATSLEILSFQHGVLTTLPEDLFKDASNLRILDLTGNNVTTLSRSITALGLRELDLSYNDLDSIYALANLKNLTRLNLAHNSHLSVECDYNKEYSPIHGLISLEYLNLQETNVTRICSDWRMNMTQLKTLDLRRTNIIELSYKDLQFSRDIPAEVSLAGAPVTVVKMSQIEYKYLMRQSTSSGSHVIIYIDAGLSCDCSMFWVRRAIELGALDHVNQLRCAGGLLLRDKEQEEMVCPLE